MTKREFLTAIKGNENLSKEMRAFAVAEIATLDKRNEKRKATPTKTQKQNVQLFAEIAEVLRNSENPMTSPEVASVLGISTQKASALCARLPKVQISEVKVKGKGKLKAYALPIENEDEVESEDEGE